MAEDRYQLWRKWEISLISLAQSLERSLYAFFLKVKTRDLSTTGFGDKVFKSMKAHRWPPGSSLAKIFIKSIHLGVFNIMSIIVPFQRSSIRHRKLSLNLDKLTYQSTETNLRFKTRGQFCKFLYNKSLKVKNSLSIHSAKSVVREDRSLMDWSNCPDPRGLISNPGPIHNLANSANFLEITDFDKLIWTPRASIIFRYSLATDSSEITTSSPRIK